MGLFHLYYDQEYKNKPYGDEAEYRCDVFAYVDMCLSFACAYRLQDEEGKRSLGFRRSVFQGIAVTQEEALQQLQSDQVRWSGDRSGSMVRQELLLAKAHMMGRLAFTPKKGEGFLIRRIPTNFGLSHLERFLFVLSMAGYQDMKYEGIFSYLQEEGKRSPTLRLAFALYEMAAEAEEEEKGRLLQLKGNLFEYLVIGDLKHSGAPTARMFFLSGRVYNFMLEGRFLNPELEVMTTVFQFQEELSPVCIRAELVEKASHFLRYYAGRPAKTCNILHIYGKMGNGRRFAIKHAAKSVGYHVLFVEVSQILGFTVQELIFILRALKLECRLTGSIVCFMGADYQEEEGEAVKPFPQILDLLLRMISEQMEVCIWVSEEKSGYLARYPLHFMVLESPMLTINERIILWRKCSGKYCLAQGVDLVRCANQYVLTARGIQEALKTADMIRVSESRQEVLMEDILCAVRQRAENQLGRYAALINGVFTWDDLIVNEQQKRQMKMICDQVRYRSVVGEEWGFYKKSPYGNGICAMFYGSPGTGKTMAVQVIAHELGLDLYRIDLSQMVSKYIGETEKNISALFQKAKNINALLFFDEADSLFAKRSEVKDSNDRNANGETAHLLQKLEDYSGITILATNYANNIDDAFKRRIRFMVDFVFPTESVRYKLWTTIIPGGVPYEEEIDFEFFAKNFELSGSNIKEVLTNAAYLAASEQRGLANCHLVEAIKLNFAKYGKILTAEDFGYLQ